MEEMGKLLLIADDTNRLQQRNGRCTGSVLYGFGSVGKVNENPVAIFTQTLFVRGELGNGYVERRERISIAQGGLQHTGYFLRVQNADFQKRFSLRKEILEAGTDNADRNSKRAAGNPHIPDRAKSNWRSHIDFVPVLQWLGIGLFLLLILISGAYFSGVFRINF